MVAKAHRCPTFLLMSQGRSFNKPAEPEIGNGDKRWSKSQICRVYVQSNRFVCGARRLAAEVGWAWQSMRDEHGKQRQLRSSKKAGSWSCRR